MPISRDQAAALADLVCVVRPTWNTRGVMAALKQLEKHPASLPVIAWAALRAAGDTENVRTPAVIPLNGPHWNLADRPPTPRLTPDDECRQHPGQWRDACRSCTADRIAKPDPDEPLEPVDRDTAVNGARAALEHARRDVTEHVHRWQPTPRGELDGKVLYRNRCACGTWQTPPEPDAEPVPSDPNPVKDPTERGTP